KTFITNVLTLAVVFASSSAVVAEKKVTTTTTVRSEKDRDREKLTGKTAPTTIRKTTVTTTGKTTGKTTLAKTTKRLGAYALKNGKRFRGAIYYQGKTHRQWTWRTYLPKWRIWVVYDPATDPWYYWSRRYQAYFPLSFMRSYPPVSVPVGTTP